MFSEISLIRNSVFYSFYKNTRSSTQCCKLRSRDEKDF